ncbi:MAG: hypothetical protein CMP66_03320 [Flavobacteriales bacterium]|nr:hypothetical protein [Flavobacteriales bacterium]
MKFKLLLTLLFFPFFMIAQQSWSLKDCLKHAAENNLTIKQAALNTSLSKNALTQSKLAVLPSFNTNASHSFNFGRSVDPYTNTFTLDRVRNNNFGASTSVTLFAGFQNINNIRMSNYDYLASKYDTEKIANDISINIITAFLQLMYNKELVEVNEDKLALSRLQVNRVSEMVDVGRLPKGNLLDTESQMAQEELQLINVQNQLDIAILNMKQLLDLDASYSFDITVPELSIPESYAVRNSEELYKTASGNLPDVKSANAKLQSAERSLAIAQGGRSPRLSLFGSIGTGYSDARQKITGVDSLSLVPTYSNYPFEEQLEDNVSQSFSFSLSIPIFNAWQVNSSISRAKIGVLQSQYNLQQAENQLRKQIEQANADALAAHKKYLASQKSVQALSESFRYTEEKYNVELVSTYEYNDAKNRLFRAEADLLQSKYDYIFKIKILDFYTGDELTF